jgi:hypothetical protein
VEKVKTHVEACFTTWQRLWGCDPQRFSVLDAYDSIMTNTKITRASPVKSIAPGTPSKSKKKAGDVNELTRLALMRQLAEIWRDGLKVADVPDLCLGGDEDTLKRVKVSCAATVQSKRKQKLTWM